MTIQHNSSVLCHNTLCCKTEIRIYRRQVSNLRKSLSECQCQVRFIRAWRLNRGHVCAFERVDEFVSGGKPPAAEKGRDSLLSWQGSHYWVCITCCKMRHSVTRLLKQLSIIHRYKFDWLLLTWFNSWTIAVESLNSVPSIVQITPGDCLELPTNHCYKK